MSYTYSEIKTELNDMIHNKAGSIASLRSVINRAARSVNDEVDLRSTKREIGIPVGFYNTIDIAPAPSDLKDDAIIDLVPLAGRVGKNPWKKLTVEEFERRKRLDDFLVAVDERDQLTNLRVYGVGETAALVMHECDSITDNGTWAASGSAENLEADSWNFLNGSASLRFDTTASASDAVLTNSGFTAVSLSDYKDKGKIFLSLYIPSATAASTISAVGLTWGQSAAYYNKSVSVAHDGLAFRAGWNILSFDWVTATITGSPDLSAVNYLKVNIDWDGTPAAFSDFRIDRIVAVQGILHNILYYSNYYWTSSAGTKLEKSTADTDILVANESEKNLVLYKAAIFSAQILREVKADLPLFISMYDEAKKNYSKKYKSERKPLTTTYYEI